MRRVDHARDFVAGAQCRQGRSRGGIRRQSRCCWRSTCSTRAISKCSSPATVIGNLVHLFERDCSVQRNNQKVLEEAPAPNLPASVRAKTATMPHVKLGRAIGYDFAGTVEFIIETRTATSPYFLEMNTRLQVEHPVTEFDHRRRSGRVAIAGGGGREAAAEAGSDPASTAMRSRRASPPSAPISAFSR